MTGLEAGRYALAVQLPSEAWYVKSLAQETASVNKRVPAPLRAALTLTAGQNQTGLIVTLAEMMFATHVGLNVDITSMARKSGAIPACSAVAPTETVALRP